MTNFTESLADEWKGHAIRVNAIAPGLVGTPGMREQYGVDLEGMPSRETIDRFVAYLEETADIAQFLCSPASSYLNGALIEAGLPASVDPATHIE